VTTAGMLEGMAEASPRLTARMAGALWLLYVSMSGLAGFARRGLVVGGQAAATATNILAHEPLFRLSFAADLLAIASYIAVTALVYGLFKPVNRTVSLLATFFSLTGCIVQSSGCLFEYAPLIVLKGAQPLSAFKVEELQALAYIFLKLYSQAYTIALVFFAFFNLLIGYLTIKSTFLPRILGALMAVSGMGWLFFLAPTFAAKYFPYILATAVGEGLLFLWLLVVGVNPQRWKERARAAQEWR